MKLTNSRTGGAGRGNGKLAVLLIVICGIEMCKGQQTLTQEQLQRRSEGEARTACLNCKLYPATDCLKKQIEAMQLAIDHSTHGTQTVRRRAKKLLEDCCNNGTGELDKCTDDKIKQISSAEHLAPKACLMLLSLGTLMMAWLY